MCTVAGVFILVEAKQVCSLFEMKQPYKARIMWMLRFYQILHVAPHDSALSGCAECNVYMCI